MKDWADSKRKRLSSRVRKLLPTTTSNSRHVEVVPRQTEPRVPTELVVEILSHVHANLRKAVESQVYLRDKKDFYDEGFALEERMKKAIGDSRRPLYNAALVARTWRQICTPLLYAYPTIVTPRQLELFRKRITKYPELARLVKAPSIMIARGSQEFLPKEKRSAAYAVFSFMVARERQAFKETSLVLRACPAFSTLSLQLPNEEIAQYYGWEFMGGGASTEGLLRLNIVRSSLLLTDDATRSFTSLRVLSLNASFMDYLFRFPYLPNLHTLHILNSSVLMKHPDDPNVNYFPQPKFPSLRTVYLHQNSILHRHIIDLIVPQELRELDLIGEDEVHAFGLLATYSHDLGRSGLAPVEYLTIGDLGDIQHPLGKWKVSEVLKSLTIFVDLSSWSASLDVLTKFLEYNGDRIQGRCTSLKTVVVNLNPGSRSYLVEDGVPLEQRIKTSLCRVESLCRNLGLTFRVVVVDVLEWITQRGEDFSSNTQ
ncbi:hypothetical protein NLI96_g3670 [Meripilus lineatus]|uniref:Uncharacterized protein n=1 Tax=Meripilus lineatus TaxID=2056292 RepID=A0AAD5V6C2_9APHY|nr:hypothetical protein NLI96_g3670 [Physisporinus lineatus]